MVRLEKKILTLIRHDMLERGETVVVGVSAGPDSMALLHVLSALRDECAMRLIAVYVDHGLRPDETGAEKVLVEEQAHGLNVIFESACFDVSAVAREKKMSIEHAARDVRYSFFEQVAAKYGAKKIAVAHTADDQAEEVLLRLIRGTGRAGLSGMQMSRQGKADMGSMSAHIDKRVRETSRFIPLWYKIIRPFLSTPKAELLSYLDDKKILFLVDSSNLEKKFLRNRVRHDLLPYLAEFNPNISETLRQTAIILQDEEKVLAELTEKAWLQMVAVHEQVELGLLSVTVDLVSFLSLNRAIKRRLAEKMFIILGSVPQFKKIEQILYLARQGETGARLHFSKGLRLKKNRESFVLSYPRGKVSLRGDLDGFV